MSDSLACPLCGHKEKITLLAKLNAAAGGTTWSLEDDRSQASPNVFRLPFNRHLDRPPRTDSDLTIPRESPGICLMSVGPGGFMEAHVRSVT